MENKTLMATLTSAVVQTIVLQAVLVPIVDEMAIGEEKIKVVKNNDEYIKSYAVDAQAQTWALDYDSGLTVTYGEFSQPVQDQPLILLTTDTVCAYFDDGIKAVAPNGTKLNATHIEYNGTSTLVEVNGETQTFDQPASGYLAIGLGEGAKAIQTKAVYDVGCGAKHDSTDSITVIGLKDGIYGQSTQTVKNFERGEQNAELRSDDGSYNAKADVVITQVDENYTVDSGDITYNG